MNVNRLGFLKLLVLCALASLPGIVAYSQPVNKEGGKRSDIQTLVSPQTKLSEADADKLEKLLESDPNSDKIHQKLLIYYGEKARNSPEFRKKQTEQALWQIKFHPDYKDPMVDFLCVIDRNIDEDSYLAGKKLWLDNIKVKDYVSQVQANAAWYFQVNGDFNLAETALMATVRLEPKSQLRAENLGLFYNTMSHNKSGTECAKYLNKSLLWLEKGRKLGGATCNLPALAYVAYEAKSFDKAQKYAQLALDYGFETNDPSCLHYGNILLGRLSLRSKDLNMAKKHLGEAAKFPQGVKYSGEPNMVLAKELLERGEKTSVLQYFQQCGRFWVSGKTQLKEWTALVKKGKIPEFGASISY